MKRQKKSSTNITHNVTVELMKFAETTNTVIFEFKVRPCFKHTDDAEKINIMGNKMGRTYVEFFDRRKMI